MKSGIRIIGGKYRGRRLKVMDSPGLRPTSDRIKETVFNWLQSDIPEAEVLDAFAGSGSLGIEALSRGAKKVVMLEHNRKVYAVLQQQLKLLNDPAVELYCQDSLRFLSQPQQAFDVIFLDPPFDKQLWQRCCEMIYQNNILKEQGLLYLESNQKPSLSGNWKCEKYRVQGAVHFALFRRLAKAESA